MFIHLPDLGVLFVGDFIMPYLGAPFVVEGDFQGLLDAIDIVVQKNPRYMLHGHEPLTRNFSSPEMLAQFKVNLSWLRDQARTAVRRGDTRAAIHQANLIPPGLLNGRAPALRTCSTRREWARQRGRWRRASGGGAASPGPGLTSAAAAATCGSRATLSYTGKVRLADDPRVTLACAGSHGGAASELCCSKLP